MDKVAAKLLRILLTGSAFLLFWVGGSLLSWVVLPLVSLFFWKDRSRRGRVCRRIVSRSFRGFIDYSSFLRLIDFDSRQVEGRIPDGTHVLVANHPTLLDVVLLLSAHPRICVVVRGTYFHGPFVGVLLRLCNHIDAGDGSPLAGAQVITEAIERLRAGDPVLIFPEGTRSPADTLHPFKKGAFVMASAESVPIVPVVIRCTPRSLMKGVPWYKVPDGTLNFAMSVLPPIPTERYHGDVRALAADVRALFEQHVNSHASPEAELPAAATS